MDPVGKPASLAFVLCDRDGAVSHPGQSSREVESGVGRSWPIGGVRLADMLVALAKLNWRAPPFQRTVESVPPVAVKPSDKITMDALYPRYANFIRAGDTVVLETGSSSLGLTPMPLADGVRVEAQVLWGSIGWATAAAFGVALADPSRRVILITGEGSHQLTANEIGSMGRFAANIITFVLNNEGYLIERALEENPDWSYNDLAPWRYAELPARARMRRLGHRPGRDTRRTRGRDEDRPRQQIRLADIEVIGGRLDMPPILAFAHSRLENMYGDTP